MTQTLILTSFVVYLFVMVYIGYYYGKKKTSNSAEFYLGGRQLGPLVAAMSAEASDMSSWLLMGIPGLAFVTGLADPFWTVLGLGIGTYLNWLYVTLRLRRYTVRVGAVTIPEFFSKRFHDRRNILMCISAIIILIFFVPYTASGFKAVGTLLNSLFGFPYHESMIVGACIIVAYTVMGGFMAVSTTDLIQSIVMTLALAFIVFFALDKAGGIDTVITNAEKLSGYFSLSASHDIATGSSKPYGLITIISTMAWGLGYFGMPHILLRFMAIKDEKQIPISRRIATTWVFISMFVAIAIVLAWNPDSSIFNIVSFAWAGFGAAFGPVMLCSLFWKRTTLAGAISGMVAGAVMIFVWKYGVRPIGGIWDIYELLPAFLVSAIVIFTVSLLTKKPDDDILADFEYAAQR